LKAAKDMLKIYLNVKNGPKEFAIGSVKEIEHVLSEQLQRLKALANRKQKLRGRSVSKFLFLAEALAKSFIGYEGNSRNSRSTLVKIKEEYLNLCTNLNIMQQDDDADVTDVDDDNSSHETELEAKEPEPEEPEPKEPEPEEPEPKEPEPKEPEPEEPEPKEPEPKEPEPKEPELKEPESEAVESQAELKTEADQPDSEYFKKQRITELDWQKDHNTACLHFVLALLEHIFRNQEALQLFCNSRDKANSDVFKKAITKVHDKIQIKAATNSEIWMETWEAFQQKHFWNSHLFVFFRAHFCEIVIEREWNSARWMTADGTVRVGKIKRDGIDHVFMSPKLDHMRLSMRECKEHHLWDLPTTYETLFPQTAYWCYFRWQAVRTLVLKHRILDMKDLCTFIKCGDHCVIEMFNSMIKPKASDRVEEFCSNFYFKGERKPQKDRNGREKDRIFWPHDVAKDDTWSKLLNASEILAFHLGTWVDMPFEDAAPNMA